MDTTKLNVETAKLVHRILVRKYEEYRNAYDMLSKNTKKTEKEAASKLAVDASVALYTFEDAYLGHIYTVTGQ